MSTYKVIVTKVSDWDTPYEAFDEDRTVYSKVTCSTCGTKSSYQAGINYCLKCGAFLRAEL